MRDVNRAGASITGEVAEQLHGLVEGGIDLALIETMSVDTNQRTMMGVAPAAADLK